MNCWRLLGYLVTSLLFIGSAEGTPLQNPCTVPQSCSEAQRPSTNGTTYLPACRCDERCHLYDDCCFDAPTQRNKKTGNQLHGQIGCELFGVVDKIHYVYLVSSCPEFYPDEDIVVKCNNSTIRQGTHDRTYDYYPKNLSVEYVLKKLPVSSKTSGVLYRNAFCAVCNEEFNFEFWKIRFWSTNPIEIDFSVLSYTDLLGVINGSRVNYGPPRENLTSRSCSRSHVADCMPNWSRNVTEEAESVRSECRSYQSYVQVLSTLYRNSHCALCNLVSEGNMRCTDLEDIIKGISGVDWPDPLSYCVLLDFSSGFWDIWTAPNSIGGKRPPADVSMDDCETLMNETTTNATVPCRSQDSSLLPKNAEETTGELIMAYLTFVGNILSVISLSFLLLAYCCIPSLRNTPGRCLMCLCVSLLLAQLLFAAFGNYDNQIPSFDSAEAEEPENETETNAFDQSENETEINAFNQWENETETNAFDQLGNKTEISGLDRSENETETNAVDQYNEIESVWNKSTTLLDENRPSITANASTVSDDEKEETATVSYSDRQILLVRREEIPTASTQFTSNESPSTTPVPEQVKWTFRKDAKSIVCYASSLISHYFYLAYFCWSNTMAIDVWRTFRTLSSSLPSQADLRKRHFVYYSIYSWSVPAAIVTVAVVMDAVEASVRPLYAVRFCWISNPFGLLIFLYVPCLLVTAANILLFILSSVNICYSSMDDVQSRFGGRGLEGRQRLFLYVRLASVMGITWVSGLLASVAKSTVLWYVFVITTAFQGVYIGLCFMATNQMRKQIKEKFRLNYTSSLMTKSSYK